MTKSLTLKSVVEENSTKSGRAFDLVIQSLILISLASYAVETLPDLSVKSRQILGYLEVLVVFIFSIEYILRIYVATDRLKFIRSGYGLLDLAAILPYFLALLFPYFAMLGLDLRSIRIFRLLRLFRAFKVVRYSKALRLFHRAFQIAKEELVIFGLVAAMLLYFAAAGIHFFENAAQPKCFSSIFTSLWWAVVTLTTVGYGDVYPITDGGRIFTFFILIIGLGVIAVPSGIVASALGKARDEVSERDDSDV